MRERAELQPAIIELAEVFGYRVYHVADVRRQLRSRTGVGFPDLLMARAPRLLSFELKGARNPVTDEQQAWLAEIGACTEVRSGVWRPKDWLDGTVERVLRGEA